MRSVFVVPIVAVLLLEGCTTKEQRQQDLATQLRAVNDQLQEDCPKFDKQANAGIVAALGQNVTQEQKGAVEQRRRDIQAKLNSPHCNELQAKSDDLYRQGLALQSK
jgi:outer membrane biogenesis lipoprotein LolB